MRLGDSRHAIRTPASNRPPCELKSRMKRRCSIRWPRASHHRLPMHPCEKIRVCKPSPSSACSWSGWAPWATFCTPCRPSQRCAWRILAGSSTGSSSPSGARCSPPKQAQAATPATHRAMQPVVDQLHFAPTKDWRTASALAGQTRREIGAAPSPRSRRLRRRDRPAGRYAFGRHRPHGAQPPSDRRSRAPRMRSRAGSLPSASPRGART